MVELVAQIITIFWSNLEYNIKPDKDCWCWMSWPEMIKSTSFRNKCSHFYLTLFLGISFENQVQSRHEEELVYTIYCWKDGQRYELADNIPDSFCNALPLESDPRKWKYYWHIWAEDDRWSYSSFSRAQNRLATLVALMYFQLYTRFSHRRNKFEGRNLYLGFFFRDIPRCRTNFRWNSKYPFGLYHDTKITLQFPEYTSMIHFLNTARQRSAADD